MGVCVSIVFFSIPPTPYRTMNPQIGVKFLVGRQTFYGIDAVEVRKSGRVQTLPRMLPNRSL